MKGNRIKFIVVLLASVALSLYAQDEGDGIGDLLGDFGGSDASASDAGSSEGSVGSDFEMSLLGDHSAEFHAPVEKDHMDLNGEMKTPKFKNDFGVEVRYKDLKLVSHWALDLEMNDTGDIEEMLSATPLENAIYWTPWKLKIGAGFQYYTWGTADKLNPTDNINPRDYRTGAESEKLSVLSASLNLYPTDWLALEGVYVPFEQSNYFPMSVIGNLKDQTFYNRKSVATGLTNAQLGELANAAASDNGDKALFLIYLSKLDASYDKDVTYDWADYDYKNFLAGGKVNFYTSVLDWSFSYLYDIDPYWTPEITVSKQDMSQLLFAESVLAGAADASKLATYNVYTVDSIKLERRRIHRFGADLKKTIDKYGLWLEACYSMTDDYTNSSYKVRNDQLDWTLGMDFNFGPESRFYANIQYAGDWVIGYDDTFYQDYEDGEPDSSKLSDKEYMEKFYYRALVNKLGSQYAGLTQGITFNLKFPFFNDMCTPEITAGYMLPLLYDTSYETKYGAMFARPKIDIMPFDSFHITIGAELYYAWHKLADKSYVELDTETDKIGLFTADNNVYITFDYKWGFDLRK